MAEEVVTTIEASGPRRVMGVGMLAAVGVILLYVAFSSPPSAAWLVFLLAVGLGALWLAARMWQATAYRIELTEEVLRCSDGTEIARIADIEAIDRGFFAFKPSNGFLMRRKTPGPRAWFPGLWWRMGRRIGVGGVTPGSQSKAMSEILAAMIARRDLGTTLDD
ncbi:hypothetical protein PXK00_16035 [Phaeobacter sp. QD34_3]|uniref:hypothetical protein n=1 Tax=unclassified Phaeobacter TaxID=2621772 RepID=UPI00237F2667|nr:MULTISPECIES: hypothetical protein [unclassified Phaeobacter]MDE4134628.1 hypothetical protein [Phaeobacter sp. QD34_3]MDE4138287.1 hypothetical protein [Phaeobacter sp. QD34_24]MDE4175680.1 hypothetical protein [Phaeobacter sp. PT47_59]